MIYYMANQLFLDLLFASAVEEWWSIHREWGRWNGGRLSIRGRITLPFVVHMCMCNDIHRGLCILYTGDIRLCIIWSSRGHWGSNSNTPGRPREQRQASSSVGHVFALYFPWKTARRWRSSVAYDHLSQWTWLDVKKVHFRLLFKKAYLQAMLGLELTSVNLL